MGYHLNFGAVWRSYDLLLSGLGLGLFMAIVSIFVGCWIGLAAAFATNSKHVSLRRIAGGYVTAIRNIPILLITLVSFFVLPRFGIRIDKVEAFVLTLSIYAGAYLA